MRIENVDFLLQPPQRLKRLSVDSAYGPSNPVLHVALPFPGRPIPSCSLIQPSFSAPTMTSIEPLTGNIMKLLRISRAAVPMALTAVALAGCAVMPPTGPSVVALPPSGKPLNQFQQEDYACRDYAFRSDNAAQASQSAMQNGVGSTAIGTLGGAAAGALLG